MKRSELVDRLVDGLSEEGGQPTWEGTYRLLETLGVIGMIEDAERFRDAKRRNREAQARYRKKLRAEKKGLTRPGIHATMRDTKRERKKKSLS